MITQRNGFPTGYAGPIYPTVPYPKLKSKCIIDCHMHIMSGRCTPLPLLWNQGLFGKRVFVEWLASSSLVRWFKSKNIGRLQKMDAQEIAKEVIRQHDYVFNPENESDFADYANLERLTLMISMPMDMEYAHYEGYNGSHIYYKSDEKTYYWRKLDDKGKYEEKKVTGNEKKYFKKWQEQWKQITESTISNPWKIVSLFHYDPRRWQKSSDFVTSKDESVGAWDYPFDKYICTPNRKGISIGFKMYTALGYKPADENLPNFDLFFARCATEGIPIVVHGSAGGMTTHEAKLYLEYEKNPEIKKTYKLLCAFYDDFKKVNGDESRFRLDFHSDLREAMHRHPDAMSFLKKRDCLGDADEDTLMQHIISRYDEDKYGFDGRMEYYNDNFVFPGAWRKVLKKYPNLKVCFAHFGGEEWVGDYKKGLNSWWIKEVISLINDYPNVYTDISYFNTTHSKDYRNHFVEALKELAKDETSAKRKINEGDPKPKTILDRIMWGTDWYMTEIDNLFYGDHCKDVKVMLDRLENKDKTLWLRFSMINPYEFYRLDEIADNYSEVLIEKNTIKNGTKKATQDQTAKAIRSQTATLKNIRIEINKFKEYLRDCA